MKTITLSKSRFISGLQCPKRLYIEVRHPELLPPPDPGLEALFDQGRQVGLLATKLYPDGQMVEWGERGYKGAVKETKKLLADRNVPAIFEAAFEVDGLRIKADILLRRPRSWDLLEVKQGTKVKDENLWDVAFQKYVLSKAGVRVPDSYLVHLNREYVYAGGDLDLKCLFVKADLNKDIRALLKDVPSKIDELVSFLRKKKIPKIEPGSHCSDPYDCPLWDYCTSDKPEHWVQGFYRLSKAKKEELGSMGVDDICDIPGDFSLSAIQERIRDVLVSGEPYFDPQLKTVLSGLNKPVHYLDFETFNPGIPRYAGTSPYDVIPFQWSLHIENKKGKIKHQAFLADGDQDPRAQFLKTLLGSLAQKGDILIYTSYETGILRSLIPVFPRRKAQIKSVIDRFVDLCAIIRNNVYHTDFCQSFSLKNVLPTLVPELAYDDLEIQDGGTASRCFQTMLEDSDLEKKAELRKALLDYCERDTMGMVALMDFLLHSYLTA